MRLFYFFVIFIVFLQSSLIIYNTNSYEHYGLYNRDVFSYYIQVKASASDLNPFNEPVLYDGKVDFMRIPFSFPHFTTGVISRLFNPVSAYLLLCIIGSGVYYWSLFLLGRSFELSTKLAAGAAFVHYVFFQLLSQLPPLSVNQLGYVTRFLSLDAQTLYSNGPRHYPHDIFFYPLLYSLLALTVFGMRRIMKRENISLHALGVWVGLCMLLPFNYFYHWFEFMFILSAVAVAGMLLNWWDIRLLYEKYTIALTAIGGVFVFWTGIVVFQNHQVANNEGYLFSLMSGFAETRIGLFPPGAIVRICLWIGIAILFFRVRAHAVVLCLYLMACMVLLNMQVIVGKTIQPGHWLFGSDRVFAWLFILVSIHLLVRWCSMGVRRVILVSLILFTSVFFVLQSLYSWRIFFENSKWPKERAELVTFLNQQPSGVLLVPELWLETDLLIATHHYSYLPRGAQSVVSKHELWHRLTSAAILLGYSQEGFKQWIHTRAIRFFGFLYSSDIEFSSSLFFDPSTRDDVLKFERGEIVTSDMEVIEQYLSGTDGLVGKLDYIVLHRDEICVGKSDDILFENSGYRVIKAPVHVDKKWGVGRPVEEKPYPLTQIIL